MGPHDAPPDELRAHADRAQRAAAGGAGDLAALGLAESVVRSLAAAYGPPRPEPVCPAGIRGISLDELRRKIRESGGFAGVFGDYRDLVLRHEESCARRLAVLCGTANTLLRLRDTHPERERLDTLLDELGRFVYAAWGVDLDLAADRGWPLRAGRRYDLLPVAWRAL